MKIKNKLTGLLLAGALAFTGVGGLAGATASGATMNVKNKIEENAAIARQIAEEGTVLLKNDYRALPLLQNEKVAGLGAAQDAAQVFGGGGSGWVNATGMVNYRTGLTNAAQKGWIKSYTALGSASEGNAYHKVLYFISRETTEGEDIAESKYYLNATEKKDISALIDAYGKERVIVILNVGTVMDTSWLVAQDVGAIVLAYLGGEQAGTALANVLTGQVTPSGKTVDTWAKNYDFYPSSNASGIGTFAGDRNTYYTEDIFVGYRYFATFDPSYDKVNYEFGYGLSYTDFALSNYECKEESGKITVSVTVKNTGVYTGKEVVQVYYGAPQGKLGAPAAELVGFKKTGTLYPGQSEKVSVSFDKTDFARYDDTGKIKKDSWVIEEGAYPVYVGTSVKNATAGGAKYTYRQAADEVLETTNALRDSTLAERLLADGTHEVISDGGTAGTVHTVPAAGGVVIQAENYASMEGVGTSEIYYLGTDFGFGVGNLNHSQNKITYKLNVEKAGIYNIAFNMASAWNNADMFRLFVNGVQQNLTVSMSPTHTENDSDWYRCTYLRRNAQSRNFTVDLPAGEVELRFEANGQRFMNFDCFEIFGNGVAAEKETLIQAENFASSTLGTEHIVDGVATERSNKNGSEYVYTLNVERAGKYYLAFRASNVTKAQRDVLAISVNGAAQNVSVDLKRTAANGNVLVSNYHKFTETDPVEVTLPAGAVTLKLTTKNTAVCCIDSIRVIPEALYVAPTEEAFEDNTNEFVYNDKTAGVAQATLITYDDVYEDIAKLDDFLAQFSIEELAYLLGLDQVGQNSAQTGTGGVGGYNIDDKYGIPSASTSDGPAGIRYGANNALYSTWFPCMTMLASTWNPELAYDFGEGVGMEATLGGVSVWLAPGVNIHRNPLCGRNFEYFSEDPLVAGIFAAEITKASQSQGVAVCVKHFAANNQETNRFGNNSCVSHRALREIYLKPFEIAVKEGQPISIMSSYNMLNGKHAASSRDLITDVLRGDWGFDGVVFSDWGGHMSHVSLVESGNTFKSWNPQYSNLVEAYKSGVLTREDFERNAADAVRFLIRSNCNTQRTTVADPYGRTVITAENLTKCVTSDAGKTEYYRVSVAQSGYYRVSVADSVGTVSMREGEIDLNSEDAVYLKAGTYEFKVALKANESFGKIVIDEAPAPVVDPDPEDPDDNKPDDNKPDTKPDDNKPDDNKSEPQKEGLSGGAIAGIVVGSVAVAGAVAAGAAVAVKKKKRKKDEE